MFVSARAEYACLAMMELASRFGDKKPVRLVEVTVLPDSELTALVAHRERAALSESIL